MAVDIYKTRPADTLNLDELRLYHQITEYREAEGLDAIPLSASLTTTAGRHVVDTRENIWGEDVDLPAGTNLHSWSDAFYYADGRAPEAMWDAPERLGTGYTSNGYEITGAGYSSTAAALEGWKDSPSHNDILTNQNSWASVEYQAIGIGVDMSSGPGIYAGRIFHVWFGAATDAAGPPTIRGSSGDDDFQTTAFADIVLAGRGDDSVGGGWGNDVLTGENGRDTLRGGDGHDKLFGQDGEDSLSGGDGRDSVYGGDGDDALSGGRSDDWLSGGAGADTLDAGSGRDLLTGGPGRDVFDFNEAGDSPVAAPDEILSFARGWDHVRLTGFDADVTRGGEQSFDFIGGARFSGEAGELRAASGYLSGDIDGDGGAEFRVELGDVSRGDLWL